MLDRPILIYLIYMYDIIPNGQLEYYIFILKFSETKRHSVKSVRKGVPIALKDTVKNENFVG